MESNKKTADVCLILEGTYPYVSGGVSSWTHELIKAQKHLTFHIIALLPPNFDTKLRYEVPDNVLSINKIFLQKLPKGKANLSIGNDEFFKQIEMPILTMQTHPDLRHLKKLVNIFKQYSESLGYKILLDSQNAWKMIVRMYNSTMGDTPFLDFFWSWRGLMGGLFSVLLAKIPPARVYHSLCTGYAGLLLARAHLEIGRPCLVTEHGIYTNERRIEISSADWLDDQKEFSLDIKKNIYERELRDFWIDSFYGYSKLCYEACDKIITLYKGNQQFQLIDGANPEKLMIIPNGIDYDFFSNVIREEKVRPTIALIGRIVPIKDIKTYIRAVAILHNDIPNLLAYIMGPEDEDPKYFQECKELVEHLNLQNIIEFTGKVKIIDYLGKIDVVVLTSISEAQPLVILEAGAAGVPTVATDVGACHEMIYGMDEEDIKIGQGGAISQLSNPTNVALELLQLLSDKKFYKDCSVAIKNRVARYYHRTEQHSVYASLYEKHLNEE